MAQRIDSLRHRLSGRSRSKSGRLPEVDLALTARRDRLVEKFTAHQLDLGGVLYEMAIRDSVVMPVLLERAAAMQAIESELKAAQAEVDRAEKSLRAESGRACTACGAAAEGEGSFCSACGARL